MLRRRGDLIISETRHGFVCANAGIDLSNVADGHAALLPVDSDRSAQPRARRAPRPPRRRGRGRRLRHVRATVAHRPHRRRDRRRRDRRGRRPARSSPTRSGRELQVTEVAIADEIAGAAELVMGKAAGVPAAIVRGLEPTWLGDGSVRELVRPPAEDLFR